jgi:ankyrin repeat protein
MMMCHHRSSRQANVNAQNKVGNTALALASFQGHTDVMAYLMQEGANAGLKDTKGQSAWDRAKVRAKGKKATKNGKKEERKIEEGL